MKKAAKRLAKGLLKRSVAVFLAGILLVPEIGGIIVKAQEVPENISKTVLFEDDFESGESGRWLSKDGAVVSVTDQKPNSGRYCLQISNRKNTFSGAKAQIGDMLQANQLLKVSSYARYEDGPEKKSIQLTMKCAGNYYSVGSAELLKGRWGEIKGSRIIPAGVDLSDVELYFETPWTSEPTQEQDFMDIYVDDVKAVLCPFSDTSGYPSLKELYKNEFLIGTAVSDEMINTSVYSNLIRQQFNSMTMENEMKPAYVLDEQESKSGLAKHKESAALNFNSYKKGMDYAKEHGIKMRGHTLVWHSQTPDWFFYENYDTSGTLAGRELMLKRMENYIKEVIAWTETNYPGVIYAWDVVNEAAAEPWGADAGHLMRQEDSMWYQTIGEDFLQKAYEYARKYTKEYAPDRKIKLFYNDYNEYYAVKRDNIVKILKPVKDAGNIDGVGMQSHIDTRQPLEGENGYMTAVRTFRDQLGLELHVTELDIGLAKEVKPESREVTEPAHTMEYQGEYFQKFMEALLKEKENGANITCVTFWGVSDALSWRPEENCLLFNEDLSRKPAFEGVVNAVKTKVPEPEPDPEKISVRQANVSVIPTQIYTGKSVTPAVTVTCNGKRLVNNIDYQLSYKNNKNIGTALITITGKGDYIDCITKTFLITVKKNKSYLAGKYKYKITNASTNGTGTVTLTGVKNGAVKGTLKSVKIGETVKIGGKNFKITAIANSAFKNCKKLVSVTIGKNIKNIGSMAFYGDKKLAKVTFAGTSVKGIGRNAFKGIKKNAVIRVKKSKKTYYGRLLKKAKVKNIKIKPM